MTAIRTLAECAARMGITKVRCQQLETRALYKLRQHPLMQRLGAEAGLIPEPDT
jgi:DNA-directed RNA polymerase sigma subunit (sigma70/sigma32)